MQNSILPTSDKNAAQGSVAERSVARGLSARMAAAREEVARLMAAAREIMRESGRLDPHVAEIVRRAGSSNQAFYRHFRSKDELLLALLEEGLEELVEHLETRMSAARSARAKVERWVAGVLRQATDPGAASATRPFVANRARLAERFPAEERRSVALLSAPLERAIEEGKAAGEFNSTDASADAEAIYHMSMGWMQSRMLGGSARPGQDEEAQPAGAEKAEVERLAAFALRGLGA